jgi:hypothetical protein
MTDESTFAYVPMSREELQRVLDLGDRIRYSIPDRWAKSLMDDTALIGWGGMGWAPAYQDEPPYFFTLWHRGQLVKFESRNSTSGALTDQVYVINVDQLEIPAGLDALEVKGLIVAGLGCYWRGLDPLPIASIEVVFLPTGRTTTHR